MRRAAIFPRRSIFCCRPSSWRRPLPPPGSRSAPFATGSASATPRLRHSKTRRNSIPTIITAPGCRSPGAGDAAPAMSATYVRRLFDQYATRFETSLVERLDYCGPALLREAVAAVMWRAGRPLRFDAMLDLGCGTGLAGAAFAPFVDGLVGVDLAPAMIARAQAKGLYQRLVTADVLDALKAEASAEIRYRLAVAADVFVYVNDIGPAVAAVADILTLDGLFAFTVETHAGEGIKLLPTLRYAHAEDYVRTVLRKSGLAVARIDRKPIRSEKAVPVDSLVVVAQASTAP